MPDWFRTGFVGGLSVALLIGLFLLWLWQPERQVRRHTENLFHSIEQRNWRKMAEFIGTDYEDQWGDDRPQVMERCRSVFAYMLHAQIRHSSAAVRFADRRGTWIGNIVIEADENEFAGMIKERVNSLSTPFELEWRRLSIKPWNWKLVRVSNPRLEIPSTEF